MAPPTARVLTAAVCFLLCSHRPLPAQQKKAASPAAPIAAEQRAPASLCADRQRALQLIDTQLTEAKILNTPRQQINLMIKAGDLLWALDQSKARSLFGDAYEMAATDYSDKLRNPEKRTTKFVMMQTELRLLVVQAIARHDAAWSKRLAERMSKQTEQEKPDKNKGQDDGNSSGSNMLAIAHSLMDTDLNQALAFARNSLQYPASSSLFWFTYGLGDKDQTAGDAFYREALGAYQNSSVKDILLFSAYPFGEHRMLGVNAMSYAMTPPKNFQPSSELQQQFIEVMLAKANTFINAPAQAPRGEGEQLSEVGQLYLALQTLEPLIARSANASDVERIAAAKLALNNLLPEGERTEADERWSSQQDLKNQTAQNLLDRAESETDVDVRDNLIAQAVLSNGNTENFDRIETLAQKINYPQLKNQILSWLYFTRAQDALEHQRLNEAASLSEKVAEPEFRAYLAMNIAEKRIAKEAGKQKAKEVLESVVSLAGRAPDSPAKARALFGVTYLFAKFDQPRAYETMIEALKTVNQVEADELVNPMFMRMVEGKKFAMFTSYNIPGFTVENTFLGLDKFEFDTTLNLAETITDRSLRAATILSLAGRCLEKEAQQKKQPSKAAVKSAKP